MKKDSSRISQAMELKIKDETSDDLILWAKKSGLSKRQAKWFKCARDEAFKSDFQRASIGCVLVYNGHILAKGHNQKKTSPVQRMYNRKYRDWPKGPEFSKTCNHGRHAEIDAISNVPYPVGKQVNWKKVEVYVYRVGIGLEGYTGLALPCTACANALHDVGIVSCFYTTGNLDKPFGRCDL